MDTTPSRTWIGTPDMDVSRLSLGCWPMSGISSLDVSDEKSIATVHAAIDNGIDFFDTAYSYGYEGRSDYVLSKALRGKRETVKIAHKVGQSWNDRRERIVDGRPETLLAQAKSCLMRLNTDYVDLMYLHLPDPQVPIAESANAIQEIVNRGWARFAGVCNVNCDQAREFITHCRTSAIQIPFNMIQQNALRDLQSIALDHNIRLVCYWVYMKGLLAGHFERDHVFDPNDKRLSYDVYQGAKWHHAQNLLDVLRRIAERKQCKVSQLVMAWTLLQSQIDIALVGAKTPTQIIESCGFSQVHLGEEDLSLIEHGIKGREE